VGVEKLHVKWTMHHAQVAQGAAIALSLLHLEKCAALCDLVRGKGRGGD
jgi:hypothetical protein